MQEAVADALFDTRSDLVEKQRDQLWAGKLSSGKDIKPPYKPRTIAIKKKKGQPTDRVTLKDTGEFYNAVFADVRARSVILDSGDYKTNKLLKKYSTKIFGLDKKYKGAFVKESLNDAFLKEVKKITGLG